MKESLEHDALRRERDEARAARDLARAEVARWRKRSQVLSADAVASEQRERRALSQALHNGAVQTLLAAAQDLTEALEGRPGRLERAHRTVEETIEQLRLAVFELHPVVLEHAGFEPALRATMQAQAARGGFSWRVDVAPEAVGHYDQLLLTVARELVVNVAKHAAAREVEVGVERDGDAIVLRVGDDGRGPSPERRESALLDGHVGLASCGARLEALGGRLDAWNRPGGGTVVRAAVPVETAPGDPPAAA